MSDMKPHQIEESEVQPTSTGRYVVSKTFI